jgi:hypothetical protein
MHQSKDNDDSIFVGDNERVAGLQGWFVRMFKQKNQSFSHFFCIATTPPRS